MKTYFKIGAVYGLYRTAAVLADPETYKYAMETCDNNKLAAYTSMGLGGVLGFSAQLLTWPLDMVGRVMMVAKDGKEKSPKEWYDEFKGKA